jgi:hypothetical protein
VVVGKSLCGESLVLTHELLTSAELILRVVASRELASFSLDNSLSKDLGSDGINEDFLDNWCLKDFSDNFLSFLDISSKGLLL